jgi:TonB family protein
MVRCCYKRAMKHLSAIALTCLLIGPISVTPQSGRKSSKPAPAPAPVIAQEPKEKPEKPAAPTRPLIAAVPNEEYKCMEDDSLAVVVPSSAAERVFAPNEVTIKAKLVTRTKPEYTTEARRHAVEGSIAVRVVVLKNGKVATVKITDRGGPFGLNESAIHAACKMEFVPASKDGERVSQWVKTEVIFRLGSSIDR